MTTQTTKMQNELDRATDGPSISDRAGDAIGTAAGTVRGVAEDVAGRLPDAAATTRDAIAQADRQMRSGSDEMLVGGATLSFGLAIGLLLGGASRFLVAAALVPVAAMALTLLDRASRDRGSRSLQGS